MPLLPVVGHETLRARLLRAVERHELPSSILLQGPRGVGKQRLALWLAQVILCEAAERPCGACTACRMALELRHPDLYWFYPRPRLKDADARPSDVLGDYAEANAERLERHGLYAPPPGNDGLYVATIRTIVQKAALAPAMGRRKVFVVGDAERMISQEGADQAANAFLKLLEEPAADTVIVLTSSEPGALLPTVRSRVVAYRCAPLTEAEVRAFVGRPEVRDALAEAGAPKSADDQVALAAGAPGTLLGGTRTAAALREARTLVDAAARGGAPQYAAALAQGGASARGAFSDTLGAVAVVLHERVRAALARADARDARRASRGIHAVARAQACADGNVNPQLIAARLLRELGECLA